MTDQLIGAAPTKRQTRVVALRIEEVEPGVLRVSMPTIGWSGGLARTPVELARLVALAFTECQVATYARWRNGLYDLTTSGRRRRVRNYTRRDVHNPLDWRLGTDGRWIAPGGRRWRPDSATVGRVMARRVQLGWPAVPTELEDA